MINMSQIITSLLSILVFFALLFGFTKLLGPIPFDINSVTTSKSDAFSVSGEGKVDVKPDSATVRLGVVARGASAEGAKASLNTNINKVIEAIKVLGVDEKDIKTENFNIYPEYGNLKPLPAEVPVLDQDRITAYSANTNISVTVKSEDLANKIVDIGVENGANQVGGVEFKVKDKSTALNSARELAVEDARKKAEDASRIAGFKLGKVINYSETEGGVYPRVFMSAAKDTAQGGGEPTRVQPGENEIMVTVTLSYEIR